MFALIAFFASVLMPIQLAVGCWILAGRSRRGWLFHLMFLPAAVVFGYALVRLLAFAIGDDGDGPPGAGLLYLPAFATLVLVLFGYYALLAARLLSRLLRSHQEVR